MNKVAKILKKVRKKGVKGSFYSLYIRYRKPVLIRYLRWYYKKNNGLPSDDEFLKVIDFDKIGLNNADSTKGVNNTETVLNYFTQKENTQFIIKNDDFKNLKQTLLKKYPEEVEKTIERADEICRKEFKWLCPNAPDFKNAILWHSNFEDERCWSKEFYMDLDYSSDKRIGDVRQTWELNRHQYFVTLGKAYLLTGNEKYAKEFTAQLNDWIEENPIPFGINWLHSQETALRMSSWIWAFYFFRNSVNFDNELKLKFFKMLYKHAKHTYWHLSRHLVTHNHLISEICGLIVFCVMFPEFKFSVKWFDELLKIYNREVDKQIWEDGPSGELSTNYHLFVLDSLLLVKILLNKNSIYLSAETDSRIEKMIEYSMFMIKPDGTIPKFGDNDSGRAFRLSNNDNDDRRAYLSTGAVLFERGDFKFIANTFYIESLLLLGTEGLKKFNSIIAKMPDKKSVMFDNAGVGYFRNDWSNNSDYLAFRGGATDLRKNVSTSHNHADFLSFDYFAYGKNIFSDPSTYLYGKDDEWRYYFRKTRAHNTVEIDGQDSLNVTASRFGVPKIFKSKINRFISQDEFDYINMSHTGYNSIGINHTRKLLFSRHKFILVTDIIEGKGEHRVKTCFNCGTNKLSVNNEEASLKFTSRRGLRVIPLTEQTFNFEIVSGKTEPIEGWSSDRYGEVHHSNVLYVNYSSMLPLVTNYLIVPDFIDFELLNFSININEQIIQFRLGIDSYKVCLNSEVSLTKNSEMI